MATFVKVAGQKDMIKVKIDGKEVWAFCSAAIKATASKFKNFLTMNGMFLIQSAFGMD